MSDFELPVVGSDTGQWGEKLNKALGQFNIDYTSHKQDSDSRRRFLPQPSVIRTLADFGLYMQRQGNLLKESSFENDTNADGLADGWSLYGTPTCSIVTTPVKVGTQAQQIVGTSGLNQAIYREDVSLPESAAGYYFVASIWCQVTALDSGANFTLSVEFHDADHVVLDYGYNQLTATTTGMVMVYARQKVPTGTDHASIRIQVNGGATVVVDAVQFERGYAASTWTDYGDLTGKGWYGTHTDQITIFPYRSNYLATGMLMAARALNDDTYYDSALMALRWYRDHMESPNYFVYDWQLDETTGALVKMWTDQPSTPNGDMDSTDSYAGTFLVALRQAFLVKYDRSLLDEFHTSIGNALTAIQATLQADGLTWCKPTYTVKYLEDQVETLAGAKCASWMASMLGDSTLKSTADSIVTAMTTGIESLYNPTQGWYYWAKHEDGTIVPCDWTQNNDSLQQAFTVAWNVGPFDRQQALMTQFMLMQPSFDRYATYQRYDSVPAWALQRVGNDNRSRTALMNVNSDAAFALDTSNNPAPRCYPFDSLAVGGTLIGLTFPEDVTP